MATAEQIADLRRKTSEPTQDPYTDAYMSTLIDSVGVNGAAQSIWMEKAAEYAEFVDTSESGSSRKLSDLHKNALNMAAQFQAEEVDTSNLAGRSYQIPMSR